MRIERPTEELTFTDKVYLSGGFGYGRTFGAKFIRSRTSLAGGSGRLLDLGCGDGFWAEILSEWYDVTGEDLSRGGIYMAQENARERENTRVQVLAHPDKWYR